jgi:hypothetical protein
MIGLQAISANNGWSMAFVGALIVMCGLASLSFIISQLHKIIGLFEKKKAAAHAIVEQPADIDVLNNLEVAARTYQMLTADLGDSFELVKLYEIFERENLPHPHLTIRAFRDAGYLIPLGSGLFSWQKV